jgi:hypothetical protein
MRDAGLRQEAVATPSTIHSSTGLARGGARNPNSRSARRHAGNLLAGIVRLRACMDSEVQVLARYALSGL